MLTCPPTDRSNRFHATASLAFAALSLFGASSCASSRGSDSRLLASFDGDDSLAGESLRKDEPEREPYAKRGFFVGGLGTVATLNDRDFDGQTILTEPTGVMLALPEVDPGLGWGLTVGYRGESNSIQYTYTASTHDDEFLGTSEEDDFKTYNLDFKHYWNVERRFQPYVLLGVCVPRLIIKDGASNGVVSGDAVFQGIGANIGGGASLYLAPRLALFGELFYRWTEMDRARGLGVNRDIMGHLDGSGVGLRGGLTYTF
jgi:hypothetical protein